MESGEYWFRGVSRKNTKSFFHDSFRLDSFLTTIMQKRELIVCFVLFCLSMYASVMDVACSLVVVVVVVVVVQTQMRKDSKRCASRGHFE